MWEYSEKVKDHYMNPRNAGMLEDSNAVGYAGSLACGDAITLFLKFDKNDIVTKAKFLAFGCGSAIAAASILTEIVIDKSIDELVKITNQHIIDALDGLPDPKVHCSVMCQEVLESAITYYKQETLNENSKIVCKCSNITELKITEVIRQNNLKNIEEITDLTKACSGCGKCEENLKNILNYELQI